MIFDTLGAVLDLLSTWYFMKLDTKAWSIGLLASIINTWIYWNQGIYADMCLSCFYCLNLSYGWYAWNNPEKKISLGTSGALTCSFYFKALTASILLFLSIFYVLIHCTNINLPFLNASVTSLSLIGQWLMTHKIILAWAAWFFADILYMMLYLIKELPGHVFLMLIYTALAGVGFYQCHKKTVRVQRVISNLSEKSYLGTV